MDAPTAAARLPGPGPAWFGAVMGTGILATLLQIQSTRVAALGAVAPVILALGWTLLVGLSAGFIRSVLRDPGEWRRLSGDASHLPLWGTVSMGLVSVGSATLVVLPAHLAGSAPVAVAADSVLWVTGTALGVATALGFAAWLVRRRPGHPLPTWALPMVPPMVSATVGAGLVPRVPFPAGRALLVAACAALFALALVLGVIVIVVAYHHALRRRPIPLELSTSTWIPLGIAGQSTAAAQIIPSEARAFLSPAAGEALAAAGRAYGHGALGVGAAFAVVAVIVTARGFVRRMPFSPGWWSMTFPVGTCSLGAHHLGWEAASLGALALLCGTWTLSAVASLRAATAPRRG